MEDEKIEILKRIGIIVIILFALATCGLLIYKNINKNTIKSNDNTNTTQSNKKADSIDVDGYSKYIKQTYESVDSILLYDNTAKQIDFYANKKCDKSGAKVNLNSNGYTVNYTCVKEVSKGVWEIKGKIDNSIDFNYVSNNKNTNYFRINNYILKVESKNTYNTTSIIIYDSKTGNKLNELRDIVTPYTYAENDIKYNSNMYVKKGVLNYHIASNIHADEISYEDVSSECSINKIDFNKDYNSEKLHDYVCSYIRGN